MENLLEFKKIMAMILSLMIPFSIFGSATAQGDKTSPDVIGSTVSVSPQSPNDPAELEAFLNDLITQEIEENHICPVVGPARLAPTCISGVLV